MIITLKNGLRIGDENIHEIELRELSAGDLLDAELASEQLRVVDGRHVLVSSSALMGFEMIRRAVKKYGQYGGPISLVDLKKLSHDDFALLQSTFTALQYASIDTAAENAALGR